MWGVKIYTNKKSVLLISMPFAGTAIPAIQLPLLSCYLKKRNCNIKTSHLYLKAAEIYGLNNYNFLIYNPNESYTAQMVFSKYVFPEHWKNNKKKFENYFNKHIAKDGILSSSFSFDEYIKKTGVFYNWVIKNIDWKSYGLIGFTLNYGQFLPSLAIAKKIKELYPEKKIVLGGSRTICELGINTLKAFDYIDFIVSGDGEEALYRLASDFNNYRSIPNLIYRDGRHVVWNRSNVLIDLNKIQILDFNEFYTDLEKAGSDVKEYFILFGRLPVEISRGCWWNKCTFCSQKAIYKKYREKRVEKIVKEIKYLSDKYNILSFQLIGNTLPKKDYRILLNKLREIGKDLSFFVETRAGVLKCEDYTNLKDAGFNEIQIGVETFSPNFLKKINKGVFVIDNIAALKFCKENKIKVNYNIITNYPNEEQIDFKETMENIDIISKYLYPPHISCLAVEYGSDIFYNFQNYNIEFLDYTDIDKIMFPKEFLDKNISYIFNFKRKEKMRENDWEDLIDKWNREYYTSEINGIKRDTELDRFVFYYLDGKNYLKIYDKRNPENIKIYVLDELERRIFLFCKNVEKFYDIKLKFRDFDEKKLKIILNNFERKNIMLREEDRYLSLPLCYEKIK